MIDIKQLECCIGLIFEVVDEQTEHNFQLSLGYKWQFSMG